MRRVFIFAVASLFLLAACSPGDLTALIGSGPASTRALAVDPRDGKLLKAATDGLSRSRDDGQSWQRVTLPAEIAGKEVSHVALRADTPDIVYIAGEAIGIWRSRDGGKTWQKTTNGLASDQVSALAVNTNGYPRDSRKSLFAWVAGAGMFETQDEGDNWKRSVDTGMGLDDKHVVSLTHSPLEGSMNTGWLYASTPAGASLSMD